MNNCVTKMRTILFIVIIMLSLIGCSKISEQLNNDIIKYKLKGKVKSINEVSYKAEFKSDELVLGERKRKILFDEYDKYLSFNIEGNIVDQKLFNTDGSLVSKFYHKYDSEGNLLEEYWYNSDGSLDQKHIYKYIFDNSDKLVLIELYNASDSLIKKEAYNYNDSGELTSKFLYKPDGSLGEKESYKYDINGNLLELLNYDSDDILSTKTVYKYDSLGKILIDEWYTPDELMMVTIFEYDSMGNLDIEGVYLPQSNFSEIKKSVVFDDNGNWIKRVIYKNRYPSYIVLRDITYYE
jgi:hypothetical protein